MFSTNGTKTRCRPTTQADTLAIVANRRFFNRLRQRSQPSSIEHQSVAARTALRCLKERSFDSRKPLSSSSRLLVLHMLILRLRHHCSKLSAALGLSLLAMTFSMIFESLGYIETVLSILSLLFSLVPMMFQWYRDRSNPPSKPTATLEYMEQYMEPILMLLSSLICLVLVSVTLRWIRRWEHSQHIFQERAA